ncbi:MAG TPA: class I SAM-dependent methyltransferase [Opitutus sp.]|nr:class I SAM-dependent methyltransferase [Opitutus sp.]
MEPLANFDRLAPHYDWLEALTAGPRLQRARTALLGELAGRRNILSVGEGHGRFAAACTARFPDARLTCVEASARMIARARRRLAARSQTNPDGRSPSRTAAPVAGNVIWHQADVLAWTPPPEKFDAIATCFFLDCFAPRDLTAVVAKLARGAARDALWLVVDFAVPARGLARHRARFVHALMYAFFRVATRLPARSLTPPDDLLAAHGFQLATRREFEWGLIRADLWRRP